MIARATASAVLLTVAALGLTACGGGGSSSPSAGSPGGGATGDTSSTSGGGSDSTAAPVVVDGLTLTAQGSRLRLGDAATVSWHPTQKLTGVARLSVTKLQKMPISAFRDWRLDPATQRSTPYFVHATVRNLGHTNLAGVAVPLYLLDGRNTLLEASTFRAQFPACPSGPLPRSFTHGRSAKVCLVYFAPQHGTLTAISFRPAQDFDAITWTGPLSKQKPSHPHHHKKKKH